MMAVEHYCGGYGQRNLSISIFHVRGSTLLLRIQIYFGYLTSGKLLQYLYTAFRYLKRSENQRIPTNIFWNNRMYARAGNEIDISPIIDLFYYWFQKCYFQLISPKKLFGNSNGYN